MDDGEPRARRKSAQSATNYWKSLGPRVLQHSRRRRRLRRRRRGQPRVVASEVHDHGGDVVAVLPLLLLPAAARLDEELLARGDDGVRLARRGEGAGVLC